MKGKHIFTLISILCVVGILLTGCAAPAPAVSETKAPEAAVAPATEAKPAEVKPAEEKPAEVKPTEAAAAEKKPIKIGFILAHGIVSRWQYDKNGFVDEAKNLGVEAIVVSSEGSAQTQASQVDNMITQGVNALVIAPVDVATASSLFQKVVDAGIPVVDYNFVVPDFAPSYIIFRDAIEFGEVTAKAALAMYPEGNYVIVSGDAAYSVALDTTKGYMNVLQPEIDAGKIKIVSQKFNPGWAPQSAQTQVEEALVKTNNDVKAILSNNDGMAIGAMSVLDQLGLSKVFVAGVDADLANIQAIAQGKQTLTIWTDFYKMGQYGARAAVAAASGTQPDVPRLVKMDNGKAKEVPTVVMDAITVTQDNLCQWLKDHKWVSIEDSYKYVEDKSVCQ